MALVPTIGLEVHVQLATRTRLFSSGPVPGTVEATRCPLDPVAAGHPGTLPVLNDAAVGLAVRAALALGCTVHTLSRFDRKHYFWPDLPKGYQITQERQPLATDGRLWVEIDGRRQAFRIERLHMEEDAGSLRHQDDATLVDLSRCGVPLVEVVGAPELRSPEQAEAWARMLHRTLVRAGVTEGRMERGHLRIDANVSLAEDGQPPGTRVEIKNLNSFRFLRRSLQEEVQRQRALLAAGDPVHSETRRWTGGGLVAMRAKQTGRDYCWLPEPDLPVLRLDQGEVEAARAALPEQPLPEQPLSAWLLDIDAVQRAASARAAPGLSEEELGILADLEPLREWVAQAAAELGPDGGTIAGRLAVHDLRGPEGLGRLTAAHLIEVAGWVRDRGLSHGRVVLALRQAAASGDLPAQSEGEEASLDAVVADLLDQHPEHEARWRAGNRGMEGFFMGRLAAAASGEVDRRRLRQVLVEALQARSGGR